MAISILPPEIVLSCLEANHDNLGGQGVNLFRSALARSTSDLLDFYIRPNLLSFGKSYIYLAEDKGGKGSRPNYDPGNTIAACVSPPESDLTLPGRWGLFTNPLSWVNVGDRDPRPSDRPINIGFCVYTQEFDKVSLGEQLEIIWSGGLKKTDQLLRCFKDYRGYEVVYGGGKSLHFHFIFDLRHWNHDLAFDGNSSYQKHWHADFPDVYLREAHEDRWDFITRALRDRSQLDAEPDPALRFWEQNRRIPLALRKVERDHPLGLPAGSYVTQYVLASAIRQNIPRSGGSWLHHSQLVGASALKYVERHSKRDHFKAAASGTDSSAFSATDDEQRQFHQFLVENFPKLTLGTDIRFARLEFTGLGPKLYLYNDTSDANPSSVIQGDYTSILLQGHHGFHGKTYPIAVSPNKMFATMQEQRASWVEPDEHLLHRIFEAEVHDQESYHRFLHEHVFEAMTAAPVVLILGPEGCGKSSAVMANIDRLSEHADEPVFIASPSYQQSAEKMQAFGAMYPTGPYVPFEYLSLTELYQRHCPEEERISEIDALEMSRTSWLRAVYEEQPEVYAKMRQHRDELRQILDRGQTPVLFGVHETVRRHADTGMSRLFYARDFHEGWFDSMAPEARAAFRRHLRFQNVFGHIILDEISPGDLISTHRAPDVEWAWEFRDSVRKLPESDKLASYRAFQKYRSQHPRPREDDDWRCNKSDWQYVQEILHARYSDDDFVQITTERYPFDDDQGMYRDRIGDLYYVKPRGWWEGQAGITMLTTELVPAQLVNALRRHSLSAEGEEAVNHMGFQLFRFDRPGLFKDFVYIENHRECRKSTLPRLVEAYSDEYPRAVVISDMLKDRIDDVRVVTHLSARGSNELASRDIVAFYTAPSPRLFAELAALDSRFGTCNTIALWYVDRFNQTCGRNRGFRGQYQRSHIGVMGYRMYKWLAPYLLGWARYAFPRRRCCVETLGRG